MLASAEPLQHWSGLLASQFDIYPLSLIIQIHSYEFGGGEEVERWGWGVGFSPEL